MTNVIRVTAPQYPSADALTDTDPSHYSLFSDQDNVLIKEFERGSGTLGLGSTVTINHNLGYIPFYLVFAQVDTSKYRLVNRYNIYSEWRVYATTTGLVIRNQFSSSFTGYKYYIFYDNFT